MKWFALSWGFLVCQWVFALGPVAEKPRLKVWVEKLQQGPAITTLFKSSAELEGPPGKSLPPLLLQNQKNLQALEDFFTQSRSFARGEVEEEATLNGVIQYLQLSLLIVREKSFQSRWQDVQQQLSAWFLFAADFPYEESSLIGIRLSGVVRSLLLDEMEKIQKKFSVQLAQESGFRKWFMQVRAPWPVDRIFVSEAKRLLPPPMMSVAHSVASAFQKNPYQTSEQVLRKVRGGGAPSAELLKQIWKESDISMMKTEINRIGKLKLRLALAEYQRIHQKDSVNAQDLIKAGLIDQVPTDYFTGKPLDLTSL